MNGILITFEGVEGSGKSTQIDLLTPKLEALKLDVVVTRQPGGTPIGRALRTILLDPASNGLDTHAEALLYTADRAQHVADVVQPALEADKVCLCDRFADSTTAYQGAGRAVDPEQIQWLHRFALRGCMPDLTLLFDLPAATGLKRAAQVGKPDRIEQESLDFHERVRECFLNIARDEMDRVKVIDATLDQATVADTVWSYVLPVVERLQ